MLSVFVLGFLSGCLLHKLYWKRTYEPYLQEKEDRKRDVFNKKVEQEISWAELMYHTPKKQEKEVLTCRNKCCKFLV